MHSELQLSSTVPECQQFPRFSQSSAKSGIKLFLFRIGLVVTDLHHFQFQHLAFRVTAQSAHCHIILNISILSKQVSRPFQFQCKLCTVESSTANTRTHSWTKVRSDTNPSGLIEPYMAVFGMCKNQNFATNRPASNHAASNATLNRGDGLPIDLGDVDNERVNIWYTINDCIVSPYHK